MEDMPDPKDDPEFYIKRLNLLAFLSHEGILRNEFNGKEDEYYREIIETSLIRFLYIRERSHKKFDTTTLITGSLIPLSFLGAMLFNKGEVIIAGEIVSAAGYLYKQANDWRSDQKAINVGKPALARWFQKTHISVENHPYFNKQEIKPATN